MSLTVKFLGLTRMSLWCSMMPRMIQALLVTCLSWSHSRVTSNDKLAEPMSGEAFLPFQLLFLLRGVRTNLCFCDLSTGLSSSIDDFEWWRDTFCGYISCSFRVENWGFDCHTLNLLTKNTPQRRTAANCSLDSNSRLLLVGSYGGLLRSSTEIK